MDVGCTFAPDRYRYFARVNPPAFSRVFFRPGAGLRPLTDPAIAGLPATTVPWISHKDPVPIDQVVAYWAALGPGLYPGKRLRWTYYHEAAGAGAPNANDFLSYWRNLQAAAEDFPLLQLVQIQSNYAMRWRVDTEWDRWLIHGVALGFDCYPMARLRYEPPESMFGLLQHAAQVCGDVQFGAPELGADPRPGQLRGEWLSECVEYLGGVGASFVGLWGSGAAYAPGDVETLNAFRRILE